MTNHKKGKIKPLESTFADQPQGYGQIVNEKTGKVIKTLLIKRERIPINFEEVISKINEIIEFINEQNEK